ncbi:MAG: ABC transporter ATP-binding protein [Prevotella sp.]|jgi:ABC-2 type transport system ATP-binding protein|nr:ABC transporter ATP-binding protein [Prevotella sp.]MCH3993832.1 ABC transporter ATP-binding protein [Prevotella sp.]MCI1246752.1 ABC transporter ATP-binding protein [Prevotella sp.]
MKIELHHLIKKFGEKTAVDIPELFLSSGGITGLAGNNGAGKTTLFRLLLDLVKRDEGDISLSFMTASGIQTIDPDKSEDWKSYTGAYIDDGFLIDFLMPEEYFEFIAKVDDIPQEILRQRLDQFSAFMNGEIMDQKKLLRDFSAGNKQKIGIIGAMLNTPQLLILDEPFNFLDPSSQYHLKQLLENYARETQATILLSSHNLQHITEISDRILLMENGHILKDIPNENGSANEELDDYFKI